MQPNPDALTDAQIDELEAQARGGRADLWESYLTDEMTLRDVMLALLAEVRGLRERVAVAEWKLGEAVAELEVALCSDWEVIGARLERKWQQHLGLPPTAPDAGEPGAEERDDNAE